MGPQRAGHDLTAGKWPYGNQDTAVLAADMQINQRDRIKSPEIILTKFQRRFNGVNLALSTKVSVKVARSSDFLRPPGLYSPWIPWTPGQNTAVGSLSLLQGIFPTQWLNPGLPCCTRILYQLNHKASPRILEWVADPFSRGSSWPRKGTRPSCIAGRFFTKDAGKFWHLYLKTEHYAMYLNELKVDHRLKCKTWNYGTPKENTGDTFVTLGKDFSDTTPKAWFIKETWWIIVL